MKPQEQEAFVEAYSCNVADVPTERVKKFVAKYYSEDNVEYSSDYTSIVDALCMWNSAINYHIKNELNQDS